MITNPGASRTLDPASRSFVSVVGLHDKRLADADTNLIQSLQDWKRKQLLKDHVCSGALTYAPFSFSARTPSVQPLTFTVPAFDVLVNGDVVTIGGNGSSSLSENTVTLPAPIFWSPGSASPQASLYVVFLEFWYQRLDPATGLGYYKDPATGTLYVYPNGCVNAVSQNLLVNDTIDPFQGTKTTERVQLQWAIRVVSIDPAYNFAEYSFGLDAGATLAQTVFGQASQSSPSTGSVYQFTNLAAITGDAGLWRSGDGNIQNELGSLDGYSYALPLAVAFQRNSGVYAVDLNPFGTADATVPGSGFLSSDWTARFDGKFADVVFPEDVVDTRSVVSLDGWDQETLLKEGFVDVISGKTRTALARGETPGSVAIAAGSLLDYVITVSPTSIGNTNTIGAFDGFRNGFSSADQTFYSTQSVSVNQKATGAVGGRWQKSDSFSLTTPGDAMATIEYVQVQALVDDTLNSVKTPVLLLPGQITVTGLGSKTVTVQLVKSLTGTGYDPGLNPIYVTLGVEYPANGGMDLVKIPAAIYGGRLVDGVSGKTLPVYGISDYAVSAKVAAVSSGAAKAFNPNYSNLIFGTRIETTISGALGSATVDAGGNQIVSFSFNRVTLPGRLTGLYAVSVTDQSSGAMYGIVGRTITGNTGILKLQGPVPTTATLVVTFLAADTAQVSFNAPVKAVTAIEETVLAGTVVDVTLRPDPRVAVVSVKNYAGDHNAVVLATTGGLLTGIAGDDVNKLIWVRDNFGNFNAMQVSSVVFANGFVTITVPATVNLEVQPFFVVAALAPAFTPSSTLTLVESYVPYQGEGRTGRDYELVHTEDVALITTNGTGAAPVPGLKDIYPYNRELPVATTLPAQIAWSDATLLNQPVAGLLDSNFVAKSSQNVEHTFEVPLHTNDFIEPISDNKRKSFRLSVESGSRGFAKAVPHLGFAINPVTPKVAVGTGVTSTASAVTLFVNNVTGNDNNDGQSTSTAFRTIGAALESLPSVLRHPCSVQLIPTGQPYAISSLRSSLKVAALGDGVIRSSKYYALGLLCFTIQEAGRLVITAQAGTSGQVSIDATGFTGFGDGPTAAFFIENSRVIFNQIEFKGFSDPAIKGLDADVQFVNCAFTNNLQAASFEQGSTIVVEGGTVTLGAAGTGFVLSQSDLDASGVTLAVSSGATPGVFFVAERGSSLSLDAHAPAQESNITATTIVARAALNSSIVVTPAFTTQGQAAISQNSVLSRTVSVTPFVGGVLQDPSSNVTTSL